MRKRPAGIANPQQQGVTLMEAVVTLVLIVILLVMAIPQWGAYTEKQNLKAAAETLMADLNLLRSEAKQRNKTVTIHFTPGASWCYGLSEDPSLSCNCATAPATCTLAGVPRIVTASGFKNIQISATTFANQRSGFESTRTLPLNPGTVVLKSSRGDQVTVDLNGTGQISACSSTVTPFAPC